MNMVSPNRRLLLVLAFTLAIVLLAPFWGMVLISPRDLLQTGQGNGYIFWHLRLPRTLLAAGTGACLSLCGFLFQTLFRNPLASPYTLGVSGGASLGVMGAIKLGLTGTLAGWSLSGIAGFSGALATVFLILALARWTGSPGVYSLLMAGVAVNFFCSALILLLQYLLDLGQTLSALRGLMGEIRLPSWPRLALFLGLLALFFAATLFFHRELSLTALGEEMARTRGLAVRRFRRGVFWGVSLMLGFLISLTGPIAFVGLMVPHMARLLWRGTLRRQILGSFLLGAALMALTDLLSRTLLAPAEIPAGILTALAGAPYFLLVMIRSLRREAPRPDHQGSVSPPA